MSAGRYEKVSKNLFLNKVVGEGRRGEQEGKGVRKGTIRRGKGAPDGSRQLVPAGGRARAPPLGRGGPGLGKAPGG